MSLRVAQRCASEGSRNQGTRGLAGLLGSARGSETERWPHRIDLEGRSTLATAVLVETKEFRANGPESFTVSRDGHYVGADGFLVPEDFREFFERDPLWVRRWIARRVGRRFGQDAAFDLEQELLLYLCAPSPKSRFRERGANGRPTGCADIIQCFDPVRHYGATAARFHNFLNLCLRNRLSTILAKQRREPVCHDRAGRYSLAPEGTERRNWRIAFHRNDLLPVERRRFSGFLDFVAVLDVTDRCSASLIRNSNSSSRLF